MERRKGIAVSGIVVLVIFALTISSVMSLTQRTIMISISGSIATGAGLVTGLPSADVYVVRDDSAGKYVTINGSRTAQVLQTNADPVTAINYAITNYVPTNGKIVTNGTMVDWNGTVYPTHGNFTWEAWKTKATQISTSASLLCGVSIYYDFITINNFTYIGRNNLSAYELGIRAYGANYLTVENSTITGCTFGGILILNGVGHSIRFDNVSFNFDAYQVCFDSVSSSIISHNTVNCGGNGSGIGVFGDNSSMQTNVNSTSNTILNWGQNPDYGFSMLWHAIYYTGTLYSYIYNNTATIGSFPNAGGAFLIKSAMNYIYNNTIDGGSVVTWAFGMYQEAGGGSAWWLGPNGTMVYNNTIKNFASGGFYLSPADPYSVGNVTIANNTLINCDTGIQFSQGTVGSSQAYYENTTIMGNSFTTGTYGIRMSYAITPTDYTNAISVLNNTFTNLTTGMQIYANSMNVAVQYNTFSSCTSPAIDTSTGTAFRFNVGLTGYYMLNVTVVGSGSASPSGLGWQYSPSSTVSVTWTPSTGYARQNISIDGTNQSTTASPVNVTMSANHVVIAYFVSAP